MTINNQFEAHIGFEIHVQLKTKSKMFCFCPCTFSNKPNSNVCPICLGYPGTLPVPNAQAFLSAYRVVSALNCTVEHKIQFDRKNYYYPDLPKNYQITQFYHPIGRDGAFCYHDTSYKTRSLAITEAHLEEDAGKLLHVDDLTLCDYNRCGTPLLEVVTAPHIHSATEAEAVLIQFRRLVRFLGVCDGNMEEGSLRCDVNISLNKKGKGLGSKVEIKNLNSFRFVRLAIEYEIERQASLLMQGKHIAQQTRLWNENRDRTDLMRLKETSDDYRYFPEPDIQSFDLAELNPTQVLPTTNDIPQTLLEHLLTNYTLTHTQINQIEQLLDNKAAYAFFETTLSLLANTDPPKHKTIHKKNLETNHKVHRSHSSSPSNTSEIAPNTNVFSPNIALTLILNWMFGDIKKQHNTRNLDFEKSPLTAHHLARLITLVELEQTIHGKLAKTILEKIFDDSLDPDSIIKKYSLDPISKDQLADIISNTLSMHAEVVAQYVQGNKKILGFLTGQIMKASQGKADPQDLKSMLIEALDKQHSITQ